MDKKFKKGEMVWKSRENVIILKWKDKRNVYAISNAHTPELTETTNRHGKEFAKPNVVTDYNANMSGIHRSDQMLFYQSSLRKTVRWYKKVGVYMSEMLLINAHYAYSKYSEDANPLNVTCFKEVIIAELVGELKKTKAVRVKANFHYPTLIPPNEKK